MTTDPILERVRKLLTKAEDPGCTPEESAALNDKAAELIAKYGVDRALLAQAVPTSDIVADRTITVPAPYALDKCGLLGTIALALRCRSVRTKQWNGQGYDYRVHLFGFESDLDRLELVYTSLLVQAAYGVAQAQVPTWETPAAYRRSWLLGFTQTVGARLRAAEAKATEATPTTSGPSTALVLADRTAIVGRALTDAYPSVRAAAPRRFTGSGADSGRAAGARADLGGARIGRNDRRAGAIAGRTIAR